MDATSKLSYYLFNGHGDVVQTVDESGAVENRYDYDIFGNPNLTIETVANAIRYAGEFYDEESGLYYLRARYYDPYIGRFISEDSYWGEDTNPLSLNLYTYAFNDPIMYIDPTGHISQNQQKYLDNLIANGTSGQAAWAKNELKKEDENQKKYLNNLISSGTSGQASWAKNELNKISSDSPTPAKPAQTQANNKANELHKQLAELESGNAQINNNEVSLRAYAESKGAKVSWNSQSETVSVDLNGVTRRFDINDYKVINGRIQIDPNQFNNAFEARVTLFQHGVNSNSDSMKEMANYLDRFDNVIDLGVINKDNKFNELVLNDKAKSIFDSLNLMQGGDKIEITDKLLSHGYNVVYRTEFSNPTGGHFEQIAELSDFVKRVTRVDEKVNIVGHSKGGVVGVGYAAFYPNRVDKLITIDTPYKPNAFAEASVNLIDLAYNEYKSAVIDAYENINNEKKQDEIRLAKKRLDTALKIGTMGSQTDYKKIEGLRDLAGETTALDSIRTIWNKKQLNKNSSHIQAYAIAVNSYEKGDVKGDGIVSLDSQQGTGFLGIKPLTMNLPEKKKNNIDLQYFHTGVVNDPYIQGLTKILLKF